jgi:hypothetical protein
MTWRVIAASPYLMEYPELARSLEIKIRANDTMMVDVEVARAERTVAAFAAAVAVAATLRVKLALHIAGTVAQIRWDQTNSLKSFGG